MELPQILCSSRTRVFGTGIPNVNLVFLSRLTSSQFVVQQLQERLYMAFVDLEKAFDRAPRKVIIIWWTLRS